MAQLPTVLRQQTHKIQIVCLKIDFVQAQQIKQKTNPRKNRKCQLCTCCHPNHFAQLSLHSHPRFFNEAASQQILPDLCIMALCDLLDFGLVLCVVGKTWWIPFQGVQNQSLC